MTKTKKKITVAELTSKRDSIMSQIEEFKKKKSKELQPFLEKFMKDHCPYLKNKVYEPAKGSYKPRGMNRFVVYAHDISFWPGGGVIVYVAGWFLDKDNVPSKWCQYAVGGTLGNPSKLVLSEDQTHLPHPNSKK